MTNDDKYLLLGASGLVAIGIYYFYPNIIGEGTFAVKDIVARGKRLNNTVVVNGIVSINPEQLRQEASGIYGSELSSDLLALSRMIRSEGAWQGTLRAHVAINDLNSLGWSSLFYLLTYSTDSSRKGYYGQQYAPADNLYPHAMVRRYSTSKDSYEVDIDTAMEARYQHSMGFDPSNGATKFVDKTSFGAQEGTGSYQDLLDKWTSDGLVAYTLPEYGDNLVLFKKA